MPASQSYLPTDVDLTHPKHSVVRYWYLLAIVALTFAGLFSLPPVVLRGSFFSQYLPVKEIFNTALVVHVNLSVLVWMLAIACMLWTLHLPKRGKMVAQMAFYVAAIGTGLMVISPFAGDPAPIKNNYVPMLQNFPFVLGLTLFASGVLFCSLIYLYCHGRDLIKLKDDNQVAYVSTAATVLVAFVCFYMAANNLERPHTGPIYDYYEELFWGGGHVLQFTFTNLTILVWLGLLQVLNMPRPFAPGFIRVMFLLQLLFVLPTPFFYVNAPDFTDHSLMFTRHMREIAGIVPGILLIGLTYSYIKHWNKRYQAGQPKCINYALVLSVLLFAYGGILGFAISGNDATVPAHYHGMIVGVSLAFMGGVYAMLPQFGYRAATSRWATIQPWVYSLGQAAHVSGLALMGGYGALRKAPGSSQSVDTLIGKFLFFAGGSFAIMGGLLFVVVVIAAVVKRPGSKG